MEIFKLLGTIAIDNSNAVNAIEDTTETVEKSENKMSETFKKIGTVVATAFAIDKIKDFGIACMETAASLQASNSQFEQTFGEMADDATEAINRVANASGIVNTRLQDAATSIYAFARTTGMESTDALNMMERSLQAAADSAAYYDRSLEDTSETLKSFLKGNYENDAALGLSCTETTRNTAANKLYGESFQNLSESQKQLTLLAMVEEANQLSGAMGQAARESDGYENVLGNIKERLKQLKGKIGQPILKNVIPAIKKLTDAIDKNADKITNALVPILETVLGTILPLFVELVGFAAEHLEELAGVILTVVGVMKTMSIINNISSAVSTATGLFGKFNAALSANPIGAVVTSVGLLAAGIGALVTAMQEEETETEKAKRLAEERTQKYEEETQAIFDAKEATKAKAEEELAEVANVEDLWKELQTLCDETGKVNEADKARADFILNELNEALGTEYTMTGNQIDNYQTLQDEINNTIELKKAEILMTAAEEDYTEAIKNRTAKEEELRQVLEDIAEQQEVVNQNHNEYQEMLDKFNAGEISKKEFDTWIDNANAASETLIGYKNDLTAIKTGLEEYYTSIATYENAQAELLAGNTEEVIKLLDSKNEAYLKASDIVGQATEEQKATLENQVVQAGIQMGILQDMLNKCTEEEKETYERLYSEATESFNTMKDEFVKAGGDAGKDFTVEIRRQLRGFTDDMEISGGLLTNSLVDGMEKNQGALESSFSTIGKKSGTLLTDNMKQGITEGQQGILSAFKYIGEQITTGIAEGAKTGQSALMTTLGNVISDGVSYLKSKADIHSPSRLFAREIGEYIPSGIGMGVEDNEQAAIEPLRNVIGKMASVETDDVVNNYNTQNNSVVNQYNADATAMQNSKLDELIAVIKNLKIYLNNDTLVGELAPALDTELGQIYAGKERGR